MWRWFWRIVGLGAVLLSGLSCFFLYALWRGSALQPVADGKPIGHSLDVISLQIDILSITMAAVGIGLGVVGLFGYQNIKDVAIDRAVSAARELSATVADKVATDAAALHIENIERTLDGLRSGNGPVSVEPLNVEPLTNEGE